MRPAAPSPIATGLASVAPVAPPPPAPTAQPATPSVTAAPSAAPPTKAAQGINAPYFPLVDGTRYTYQATYRGKTFESRLLVRHVKGRKSAEGDPLFVLVDGQDAKEKDFLISTSTIGDGVYALREDGAYSASASWFHPIADNDMGKLSSYSHAVGAR